MIQKEWRKEMPVIVAIAGPSGSGKTVLSNALKNEENFSELVSMTTRDPRKGEQNGVDYHFVSEQEFKETEKNGKLIESVNYNGKYYGIPAQEVEKAASQGKPAVVVVEPIGISNIESYSKINNWKYVTIFVNNPLEILLERLKNRYESDKEAINKDSPEAAQKIIKIEENYLSRLKAVEQEQEQWVKPVNENKKHYSIVINSFDSHNQKEIIRMVADKVNEILQLDKVEITKKNKPKF